MTAPQFPQTLTVSVTAGHIQVGAPGMCRWCAIALAANTAIGNESKHITAFVKPANKGICLFEDPDGSQLAAYRIPEKAVQWMRKFDGREKVGPISFDMELVS